MTQKVPGFAPLSGKLFSFGYAAIVRVRLFKWYLCKLKPQQIIEISKFMPFKPRLLALV